VAVRGGEGGGEPSALRTQKKIKPPRNTQSHGVLKISKYLNWNKRYSSLNLPGKKSEIIITKKATT
jgi:hypothetical protein